MNIVWFHLCELFRIDKIIKTENRLETTKGQWNEETASSCLMFTVSCLAWCKFWKVNSDGCTTLWINTTEQYTLKWLKQQILWYIYFTTMFKKWKKSEWSSESSGCGGSRGWSENAY